MGLNLDRAAPKGSGAPADEIEVTPEMIEAGVIALSRVDLQWDPAEQIVASVFEAMVSAQSYAFCPKASDQREAPPLKAEPTHLGSETAGLVHWRQCYGDFWKLKIAFEKQYHR